MRSSGITPSLPPERPIPLLLLVAHEDHPKACTGRRLLHRGKVREVARLSGLVARPVLLDPHAARPLSREDREAAEVGGLLAVDCSWNRLARRGGFPTTVEASPPGGAVRRRLPFLIAANPQHFGRLGELNTVEALSAALYVLGGPRAAAHLLEGFRGGATFLELNRDRLDRYAGAPTARDVADAERALFGST